MTAKDGRGPSRITQKAIDAYRLRGHSLSPRAPRGSLVEVAGRACGIQAQFLPMARMALWARVEGLAPGDVDRALFQERTLVRTWAMRGTLHLLPTRELPIYVEAMREHRLRGNLQWLERSWGLKPEDVGPIVESILDELEEGPLTREELATRVAERLGPRVRPSIEHSWGGVIRVASVEGLVCYGPERGRTVTFTRCDRWVREGGRPTPEEAQDALLRRYLHAYGPATSRDFATWSALPAGVARATLSRAGGDVAEVDSCGKGAFALREDLPALRAPRRGRRPHVSLLPSFDPFLLGHKDKGHLVEAARYKQVFRKAGWLSPVVLVDGRCAGIWSLGRTRAGFVVMVAPFGEMGRGVRDGLGREAARLGHFLGAGAKVAYSHTVGPCGTH